MAGEKSCSIVGIGKAVLGMLTLPAFPPVFKPGIRFAPALYKVTAPVVIYSVYAERWPSWSKAHDSKSCVPARHRGFESHSLRHLLIR